MKFCNQFFWTIYLKDSAFPKELIQSGTSATRFSYRKSHYLNSTLRYSYNKSTYIVKGTVFRNLSIHEMLNSKGK